MNALSLNNLWSYIQGLALTTSNKRWLAEHLYEAASKEGQATPPVDFHINKEDLVLSPEILEPVKDIAPLPQDFDFNQARTNYIMQKYG
ncbi:MAG: hypothetical protein IJT75_10110 [Bacteroidaceae bacterium]|nr:hypothetical protein [Bacteroidaceae bacterium]